MRILPFTERVRHGDFIFIYERPTRCPHLGETFFPKKQIFFLKGLNLYLRWELGGIKHDTRRGSVCAFVCVRVCVAYGGGGETPSHGVAMVTIGFLIRVASSFIDYLRLP